MAERFARDLAARGACVVSGLAFGIDAVAHRGALAGKGITVAVLGSGLSRLYPRQHDRLASAIVDAGGAIISEFPLNMEPHAANFPRRNRIIAGISQGVCVVEAAKRSGSLITARLGGEYGRMVWAIPNRVGEELSEGIIALLRDGAVAVANAEQILDDVAPAFQKNLRNFENRGMVADAVLDAISAPGAIQPSAA
jgi:DNA processing protein